MAYTLANLRTDIRGYTEVSDTVLTDAVLDTITKNTEKETITELQIWKGSEKMDPSSWLFQAY